MTFEPTPLRGAYLIKLRPEEDQRGFFVRAFCKREFAAIGHEKEFVQINQSYNRIKGTLRGMHFQVPPHQEIKLVRCISGRVYDVIVDLRMDSATYLHYFAAELSAENFCMMYVPEGFAHGFQTLTEDCELIYHHTAMYTPAMEAGLRYDDELLGIQWPIPISAMSQKDRAHDYLNKDFKGI